jgi:hypothetical protein
MVAGQNIDHSSVDAFIAGAPARKLCAAISFARLFQVHRMTPKLPLDN